MVSIACLYTYVLYNGKDLVSKLLFKKNGRHIKWHLSGEVHFLKGAVG
jgi:hypothetical protein